jgi:hypothetical protein
MVQPNAVGPFRSRKAPVTPHEFLEAADTALCRFRWASVDLLAVYTA